MSSVYSVDLTELRLAKTSLDVCSQVIRISCVNDICRCCVVELKGTVGQIVQGDRHTVFAVEQNKALVPPNYSRYLAWGFPDMSVRIGYYDSDKVLSISLS